MRIRIWCDREVQNISRSIKTTSGATGSDGHDIHRSAKAGKLTMKLDRIRGLVKYKRELVSAALLAITVPFGVLTAAKVTGFFIALARAENVAKQAVAQSKLDPNIAKNPNTKTNFLADELKKNNLFSLPAPRENPAKAVLGIFGDEAYINGKWYKVGAKIGDVKIVAIDATSVTTEWDGKKEVFHPIDTGGSSAPSGPKSGPGKPALRPDAIQIKRADMIVIQSEASPMRNPKEGRQGMRSERQLSDLEAAKMKEKMEKVLKR